jgi:hypothetical protein
MMHGCDESHVSFSCQSRKVILPSLLSFPSPDVMLLFTFLRASLICQGLWVFGEGIIMVGTLRLHGSSYDGMF